MHKPWFLMLLIVFCCRITLGQYLTPPVRNFHTFDYNAASKNWGLNSSDSGELFVANNNGLLYYNGEKWQLYRLPNKTVIRSVKVVGDRFYTGSYEEFGYWKKAADGQLQYTSLTHLIKEHEFTSEEFWQIIHYQGDILFRSFSTIYRYDGRTIEVINPPLVITYMTTWEDRVVVAAGHDKVYELKGPELLPLISDPILNDRVVVDMKAHNGDLLIGTKLNGCYRFDGIELQSLPESINTELSRHQLNQILVLDEDAIAFGTIKNGLYIFDPVSNTYKVFNRENGLQNNTVLSLNRFKNVLWLGLDNGIDRISLNNPLSFYTDQSGELGTVYDIAEYQNTLYVGSNTGVYYFRDGTLEFLPGSQGHVWDLTLVGEKLLCGHNTGTFEINRDQWDILSGIAGGYALEKVPDMADVYMQGTYIGLAAYKPQADGTWSVKQVQGTDFPIKYLCFENKNTVWAAHPYKGLYRLVLNPELDRVVNSEEIFEGIATNYNVRVFNIKNQIVVQSNGMWYRYDPIQQNILPFDEFNAYVNHDLVYYDERFYWFIDNEDSKELIITDLKENHFVLGDLELKRRLALESEQVIPQQDSVYLITLNDGFAALDFKNLLNTSERPSLPVPEWYGFRDQAGRYDLTEGQKIPYSNSSELIFEVASAAMNNGKYSYSLSGPIDQVGQSESGDIHFQNLPHGDYRLVVSSVGIQDERSRSLDINFSISPPWYLSVWSMMGYFLLLLVGIWAVRRYNRLKLQKKQTRIKLKLEKEQQEHLARIEKDKLNHEIKQKQKELTSSTMRLARKNELILELKNILQSNKNALGSHQRYSTYLRKLNNSIDNTEDWKRFELNFKELHTDFFEILLQRFPELTSKDLKLCAYLKMNLASKEIAPLMGISTRGVEIHRYRLRKKLNLDSNQNITNYLITLKE